MYTIQYVAKLAGVSVRTLHYYDEIGLLSPQVNAQNNYRMYSEEDISKLQQILFFRELEFPLEEIKAILARPDYDEKQALSDQKKLLEIKKERLTRLIEAIERKIEVKGGVKMKNDDFMAFDTKQFDEYQEEAKKRWGNTEAWKQSQERTKHWTKKDYERIAKEGAAWTAKLADLMKEAKKIDSPEVQEMIVQHYEGLRTFYEPNYEMYKGLGQMYVSDPRFTAYYEKFGKGLAVFMRDAMVHFAEGKLGEKEEQK